MNRNLAKNTIIIAGITAFSKVLGFLRDAVLAYFYGANGVSDAYLVAQTIPEFAFSLVIQAIAVGYIPIYMELKKEDDGEKKAKEFTNTLMTDTYLLCLILIIVINIFPRPFVYLFASGFSNETTEIAVMLVRIIVIAMLGKSTVSIIGAFLQANNDFIKNAIVGIPYDLIIIVSIAVSSFSNVSILGWGIVLATLVQAIIVSTGTGKYNYHFKTHLDLKSPYIKKMTKLFLPVCVGVGANQINLIVDRTFASLVAVGGISAMNYANKVSNIMENIIVLSIATVMYPAFSNYVANKEYKLLNETAVETLNMVSVVMAPIAAGTMIFSNEIVTILFGRGAFDQSATHLTVQAMTFYSIGIVFVAWRAILTRVFYSLQKVHLVTINSCIAIGFNVVGNFVLAKPMGIAGLALSTSISSFLAVILMLLSLRKILHMPFKMLGRENLKIIIATIVMTIWCLLSFNYMVSEINLYIALILSITTSALIYFGVSIVLKIESLKKITTMVKQRI